jgi:5-formyltetrahydrofolate cyclo-ligase
MKTEKRTNRAEKMHLRMEMQKILLSISPKQRTLRSRQVCERLIGTRVFERAAAIMIYLPLAHEVDTSDAILHAWQQGKVVAVPKISWQQRHMIPVEINSLETGFSTEAGGLRNPITGAPVPFEELDLVITPALGFDRKGHRLGRGSSYYDRFFANEMLKAVRCGIGFSEQLVDSLPIIETDVPMDLLVTDEQVIYFRAEIEAQKGDNNGTSY